jgi:hypothetical protein
MMNTHMKRTIFNSVPAGVLLLFLAITGCTAGIPGKQPETSTPSPTQIPSTLAPSPTPSAVPLPGKVILVSNGDSKINFLPSILPVISELAGQSGLIVQEKSLINKADISTDWKIILFLSPPDNLNELQKSAPETQFLVFSSIELDKSPNLSVIRFYPELEAFLAGYITLIVTPDWRVGALFASDRPTSAIQVQAFKNGGYYFCGLCRSTLSPMVIFPATASLPAATDIAGWQSAVDELRKNIIYAVYVAPEIATPELLQALGAQKFILSGGQKPPDEVRQRWIATVRSDVIAPLREIWPDLIAKKTGRIMPAPLLVEDIQETLLGKGKQKLVEDLRKNLMNGNVLPLTIPAQ